MTFSDSAKGYGYGVLQSQNLPSWMMCSLSPLQLFMRTHWIHELYPCVIKRLSSSKRWQARQLNDRFSREAAVQGLKSRAAFKLLQIDEKHHIFRSGQTVVDLGYAPGSWSQVAVTRTQPGGRVLGVDIIPAQPPKGVSTIQGNFLSPGIQKYVREFLRDPKRGRPLSQKTSSVLDTRDIDTRDVMNQQYIHRINNLATKDGSEPADLGDPALERTVDVVLSDMMMNTSGLSFKDHIGSMDLCRTALKFGFDTLKENGHFVCKFYQGVEDKKFEKQLNELFQKVHRLKPESSRSESKEAYFVGLRRKRNVSESTVFAHL